MFNTAAVCLFSLGLPVLLCQAGPLDRKSEDHRHRRDVTKWPTLADRKHCQPGDPVPVTRVNTTQRLLDLREEMAFQGLHAFIVLAADAHGSRPDESRRRDFISGYKGSAGWAAITLDKAALWTDGRYFLEAEDALDCNWIFMKSGESNVPSETAWLVHEMKTVNNATIGADPFLISNGDWNSYQAAFSAAGITFRPTERNPVDVVWGDQQPAPPQTDINALSLKFAGKSWQDKITDLRAEMVKMEVKAFIVTSLDETAWLFNLRASDIANNPFFLSYAIVEGERIRLYILDKDRRLVMNQTDNETETNLHTHLRTGTTGSCAGILEMCVEVLTYNGSAVDEDVRQLAAADERKIWVTHVCNYAIYSAIPDNKRVQARSSIALAKSQKNEVERQGMVNCYNRDSAVLIEFLAMLEKEVKEGKSWTEVSVSERLKQMREAARYNRGLSFETIAGSGPNGAIIHYRPSPQTDRNVTTKEMFLLDSGGQYLDGTTDVTRTMHYGTPTEYEKECYTRVFMGQTDLGSMLWPEGLYGREIDMAARAPLWSVGLEYRHGTGHGIGAYLSVHEGPGRIALTHVVNPSEDTLHPYMFFSDEPGYYEDGRFGIRLETIVMVEPTNTTHKFGNKQFLKFKPITLVPFEPDLLILDMLSPRQIEWLNEYNRLVREVMTPELTTQLAKDWLNKKTEHIDVNAQKTSSAATPYVSTVAAVVMAVIALAT